MTDNNSGNGMTAGHADLHELTEVFHRPDLTRAVEFTLADGTTVTGYAMDMTRINRDHLPDGWHAYAIMESDCDDDAPLLTIRNNCFVNHRMDFVTERDLNRIIDDPTLENVNWDDWGFTDRTLAGDLIAANH